MKKILNIIIYIFAGIGLILVLGYLAVQFGWTNTKGIIDNQHDYFQNQTASDAWKQSEEWLILKEAILKDTAAINKASAETGIPSRMIIAPLVVEQLRLFYSEREIFKQVFAPLKILGNQSQFSWGVMGIKQETARQIENNLKDPKSTFYLGKKYERVLDYLATSTLTSYATSTGQSNPDAIRFQRLTDEHDRYYSYLYGALYIAEIEKQWDNSGFSIEKDPGTIATLYNIGFQNSKPHEKPLHGGAEINIGELNYSFGGLAQAFYDSSELIDEFPK